MSFSFLRCPRPRSARWRPRSYAHHLPFCRRIGPVCALRRAHGKAEALDLPSYREQSPEVAARFQRLRERPVILEVRDVIKNFDTPQGQLLALDRVSFKTHRREFLCVIGT